MNILKTIILISFVGVLFIGIGISYYAVYKWSKLINSEEASTLSQKYQQVGSDAISANTEQSQSQLATKSKNLFGKQVYSLMQQQDSKIKAVATVDATVKYSTIPIPYFTTPVVAPLSLSNQETPSTGALTGYSIEQVRPGSLPPLASLRLFYDPTNKNLSEAFRGSTWVNYEEKFTASIGLWEQEKTGGYKTTVSLSRTVSKPDPTNPSKMVVVGTEPLPITGANTIFTPADLTPPIKIPRWTISMGIGKTRTGYQPAGMLDYRLTDRFGVTAGAVNNSLFGGISIRVGTPN